MVGALLDANNMLNVSFCVYVARMIVSYMKENLCSLIQISTWSDIYRHDFDDLVKCKAISANS